MKYSKSILSLATIIALSTSASADDAAMYLPLTTNSADNAWIMFGVNDFSDGEPSAGEDLGAFTLTDQVSDTGGNTIATEGFKDSTATYNMGSVQSLDSDQYTVATTSNDTIYDPTQPVRSMYIAELNQTKPSIKLTYNAVLENRTLEFQKNGGAVYRAKFSETATYNNPMYPILEENNSTNVDDMKTPSEALAYNLSNSPVNPAKYSKADHKGEANALTAVRFYNYDASTATWKIWDSAKTGVAGANTLTEFEKGKAYWGRVDTDTSGTNVIARTGLVLGKPPIAEPQASIYTGKLTTPGWNMISFDSSKHPYIRNSATGLILDINSSANTKGLTIIDETGINSLTITFRTAHDGNTSEIARQINETVDAAKIIGTMPNSFNLKAFSTKLTDNKIAFISDKKFSLKDDNTSAGAVTTMTGDYPILPDGTQATAAITDLNSSSIVSSLYGEYALIVEPFVGSGSASNLDSLGNPTAYDSNLSAAVRFGTISGTEGINRYLGANNSATTLDSAATTLKSGEPVFTDGEITQIDSNFDGTADMLLLASDKAFYIKDNTFTRVYKVNTGGNGTDETGTAATNTAFTLKGMVEKEITPSDDYNATAIRNLINAGAEVNATKVYAAASGDKVIIVTTEEPQLALIDAKDKDNDYFTPDSLDANITKGAIGRVLDLSKLAREKVVQNKFQWSPAADWGTETSPTRDVAWISVTYQGTDINATTYTNISAAPTEDQNRTDVFNSLVNNINSALKSANAPLFASHNYKNGVNDITKGVITIEGPGIDSISIDQNGTADFVTGGSDNFDDNKSATAGTFNIDNANIVTDLKERPVYTPDYVNYGPLYTLKDAGYQAKVIVRASTDIASTPTTHWDHIDITDDSTNWLKENKYNLFSVDNASGYWVYLDDYAEPAVPLGYSTIEYSPTFKHTFNPDPDNEGETLTTNTITAGTFSVEVSGVTAGKSNVKLLVDNNEVALTESDSTYRVLLTESSTGIRPNDNPLQVGIFISDGINNKLNVPSIYQLDYAAPAKPDVTFSNVKTVAITDTSSDVVSYQIFEDVIPDDGKTPIQTLTTSEAAAFDICNIEKSEFGMNNFKVIALDNEGGFDKSNISNVRDLNYLNAIKGATVLSHSEGDSTSSVKTYDSSCVENTTPSKSGVEIMTQTPIPVRLAYIADSAGTVNASNELPITAYYKLPGGSEAVLKIDYVTAYAGDDFYVEYNSELYSGKFKATRSDADATFATPTALKLESSTNISLQ